MEGTRNRFPPEQCASDGAGGQKMRKMRLYDSYLALGEFPPLCGMRSWPIFPSSPHLHLQSLRLQGPPYSPTHTYISWLFTLSFRMARATRVASSAGVRSLSWRLRSSLAQGMFLNLGAKRDPIRHKKGVPTPKYHGSMTLNVTSATCFGWP